MLILSPSRVALPPAMMALRCTAGCKSLISRRLLRSGPSAAGGLTATSRGQQQGSEGCGRAGQPPVTRSAGVTGSPAGAAGLRNRSCRTGAAAQGAAAVHTLCPAFRTGCRAHQQRRRARVDAHGVPVHEGREVLLAAAARRPLRRRPGTHGLVPRPVRLHELVPELLTLVTRKDVTCAS